MTGSEVVKVFSTVNEEELIVIKSLLEDADIQYFVKGEDGRAISGFMQGMFNKMHVYVNSEDEEDVRIILEVMSAEPVTEESLKREQTVKLEEGDEGWEEDCGCQAQED